VEAKVCGIGVGEEAEVLYQALLFHPGESLGELGRNLGMSADDVLQHIQVLRGNGLVVESAGGGVRAVEPCVALPLLMARRLNAPQAMRPSPVEVKCFIARHERAADVADTLERGSDADRMAVLIERMVSKVEERLVFLVPRPSSDGTELSRPVVETALRRHAAVRSVWASPVFDTPAAAAHAEWLEGQGVPVRSSAAEVPVRAVIMDEVAVVVGEDGRPRVLRAPEETRRLSALADQLWERAMPARAWNRSRPSGRAVTRPRPELVLRLLAEGLTDDAIARRLGCSVRTVRSDVACAMTALNARSRFQAGVRAIQVGLV
jgi:DNA-binding CsgD family transcriptional regulator/biotin operon repressor